MRTRVIAVLVCGLLLTCCGPVVAQAEGVAKDIAELLPRKIGDETMHTVTHPEVTSQFRAMILESPAFAERFPLDDAAGAIRDVVVAVNLDMDRLADLGDDWSESDRQAVERVLEHPLLLMAVQFDGTAAESVLDDFFESRSYLGWWETTVDGRRAFYMEGLPVEGVPSDRWAILYAIEDVLVIGTGVGHPTWEETVAALP